MTSAICMQCLQSPEEGIGSPGTRVWDSWELLGGYWGPLDLGPLEGSPLTSQPLILIFIKFIYVFIHVCVRVCERDRERERETETETEEPIRIAVEARG